MTTDQVHFFDSDGVSIAFREQGKGDPILLIHGFASNSNINWVYPLWFKTLVDAGYRAIAIDNRGHGESEKLYDPEAYQSPKMAEDARRLLDYLDIRACPVMGYSMGTRITSYLAINHPERVSRAIFGGLGMGLVDGVPGSTAIAEALLTDRPENITNPQAIAFRRFADQTGSDRRALAACIRESRAKLTPEEVGKIKQPALVAVGTKDDIAGSPEGLAALLPKGSVLPIPGRDHMVAVGDKVYKKGVLDFLEKTL